MKVRRDGVIFALAFLVLGCVSIALQMGMTRKAREQPEAYHDWLYLPSSQYVQTLALGYHHFMADFLWLKVIQAYGATYVKKEELPRLVNYFNVITDLDPKFRQVYSFGNMVVGEEGHLHEEGLALLDKGILHNPRKYRLAFEGAFFAYWTMNDAKRAKYYVARAVKAPDCPPYVRGWTAYFDMKMGRYMAGYETFFRDFATFHNSGQEDLLRIRLSSLRRSIDDWIIADMRREAIDFHAKQGRYPTARELEEAGAFLDEEWPDWTRLSPFLATVLERGDRLPDSQAELAQLCRRFLRKGWTRLPPSPVSDNPAFPGYLIWPGQPPRNAPRGAEQDNPLFCTSEINAAKAAYTIFTMTQASAKDHMTRKGLAECPAAVQDFVPDSTALTFKDPWGGEWIWDGKACEMRSTSRPNLVRDYQSAPSL